MIPDMSVTKQKTVNLCCFVKSEQSQHLHAAGVLAYLSSLKSILIFRFVSTSNDDQTIPSLLLSRRHNLMINDIHWFKS